MVVYLAADHRGFTLKEKLKGFLLKEGFQVEDLGNLIFDSRDDYPDFSQKLARKLAKEPKARGIAICGSGIGVSIAANRFRRIRCGLGFDKKQVVSGRQDDDTNCLALPADFISFRQAQKLTLAFLLTEFSDQEYYSRRINKIDLKD